MSSDLQSDAPLQLRRSPINTQKTLMLPKKHIKLKFAVCLSFVLSDKQDSNLQPMASDHPLYQLRLIIQKTHIHRQMQLIFYSHVINQNCRSKLRRFECAVCAGLEPAT